MLENDKKRKHRSGYVRLLVVAITMMILFVATGAAQGPPLAVPQISPATQAIPWGGLGVGMSLSTPATAGAIDWQASDVPVGELTRNAAATEGNAVRSGGARRITLEQVQQQAAADPAANPFARLGQLSIEAAKQHRLGAQADYLPKIGATVANLHSSEFLGQVLTLRRPLAGSIAEVPVPLLSQNFTITSVTFVQPITPLFQVYQLVKIARADERIAMAKAGIPVARNTRNTQIEETYFKLLIAQRKLTTAELKLRHTEARPLYASTSLKLVSAPAEDPAEAPELLDAKKAFLTAGSEVKELSASLNRVMGWPIDTELELVPPAPLVESISLQEVAAEKPTGANPEVFEAEQTVVKARAATVLSKLAYMPTVAAMAGFVYQNAVPLLPNTFGYGGVMVSLNIFDFGKREHAVKEATAQLGMAEIGVELTKAKVAANIKKAYFELERSRQFSQMAQQIGSSATRLITVSSTPESIDVKAARANVEAEMLEADLAHREAYARLKALTGSQR